MRVEHLRNIVQVLRPVRDMKRNEGRVGMLGEHLVASSKQRFLAWELWPVKTPIRMFDQLFVTLIRIVHGMKESFWVGDVYGHWNAKSAAFFPDRIHARIIYRNQSPCLVPNSKPQIFQHL